MFSPQESPLYNKKLQILRGFFLLCILAILIAAAWSDILTLFNPNISLLKTYEVKAEQLTTPNLYFCGTSASIDVKVEVVQLQKWLVDSEKTALLANSLQKVDGSRLINKGDWPILQCLLFEPPKDVNIFSKDVENTFAFTIFGGRASDHILYGFYDSSFDATLYPMNASVFTITTLQFVREEISYADGRQFTKFPLIQSQAFVGKFGDDKITARFVVMPEKLAIRKVIHSSPTSFVSFISFFGGYLTMGLAMYYFLFGGGRLRVWGAVHVFLKTFFPIEKDDRHSSFVCEAGPDCADPYLMAVWETERRLKELEYLMQKYYIVGFKLPENNQRMSLWSPINFSNHHAASGSRVTSIASRRDLPTPPPQSLSNRSSRIE